MSDFSEAKAWVVAEFVADQPVTKSLHQSFYQRFGKRWFDVVGAGLILALIAPLLAVILVISAPGGAPLFGHRRVGQGGVAFRCLKFRTMVPDAERRLTQILASDAAAAREWAETHKLARDPRITRMGRFLRQTSLDELPQLVNVLRGEMSLVGPRPVTEPELERYGADVAAYLSLRPGMTGPWQVEGRGVVGYDARVAMDAAYARRPTLWGDLGLMLRTLAVVLSRKGS